jgi:hypothetical protein
MPRPWYATNARNLLDSRRQGYTPAGPVVVSMIGGEFSEAADTLYVRDDMPLERMDWRMLVDADVHLWANRTIPLARVLRVTDDIARARPRTLFLRFGKPTGEVHDVQVGDGFHMPRIREIAAEHTFSWCPTNNGGTRTGAKLRAALLAQHPAFTTL